MVSFEGLLCFKGGRFILWAPRKIMSKSIIKKKNKPDHCPKTTRHLLTGTEVEILQMVAAGYSNSRIADELCVSPHKVNGHLYDIYKKIKKGTKKMKTGEPG